MKKEIKTDGFSVYKLGQGIDLEFTSHEGDLYRIPLGKGSLDALITSLQNPPERPTGRPEF